MKPQDNIRLLIFAKAADGGTGSYLESMQTLPKYLGKKVVVKTIVLEKPNFRKIKKLQSIEFFRHKKFNNTSYSFSPTTIRNFFADLYWYRRKVNEFNPQVIIGVDAYCNLISLLVKPLFFPQKKLVLTTHINLKDTLEAKSNKLIALTLSLLIKTLYPYADVLVGVSNQTSLSLRKHFGIKKKVVSVYHGLPSRKKRSSKIQDFKHKTILSVGRLDRQKDFPTLIKSFKLVRDRVKNVKLSIIGEGEQRAELAALVSTLKLGNEVRLLGWKQNIYPFLNQANVFVLSTKREGFGYVILEAMTQGIPIIASDVPYGPSEILDGGSFGILVKPGDVEGLAKSIEKILSNKKVSNFYAKKAYERSLFFSEEKMLSSYSSIINSLFPSD